MALVGLQMSVISQRAYALVIIMTAMNLSGEAAAQYVINAFAWEC